MAQTYVHKNRWLGLMFIAPALVFVLAITIYPFTQMIYMSLFRWSLIEGQGNFSGLGNYIRAWHDRQFWASLVFTIKYTVYLTPILLVLGYLAALLTAGATRIQKFTRGVIFLPVVIGLGSSSLLWFWLFDQQVGLFNRALIDLGIIDRAPVWFADADRALWAIIISVTWKVVGLGMILFVAAIQSIPSEVNEAAMMDGARFWRRTRAITIPLTYPTITFFIIISAVPSLLAFDQFFIMSAGGPRNQTITSVFWVYNTSFRNFRLGYGSAMSVMLIAIVFAAATLQLTIMRRYRNG